MRYNIIWNNKDIAEDCRSQTCAIIAGFKLRINIIFETEKYICTKNRTLSEFYKKWAIMCTV